MALSVVLAVVWILVLGVIATAAFVYLDAPEFGMDTRMWTKRTILMPLVGFFWYVLERRERERDPEYDDRQDQFVDGAFKIHKSRADDAPWVSSEDSAETVENGSETVDEDGHEPPDGREETS